MDPTTSQIYHMTLNPPPTDVKGLVERLVEVAPVAIKEVDSGAVEKYYERRGIEGIGFKALQKIPSTDSVINVFRLLETPIESILSYKTDKLREAIANTNPAQ